MGQVTLKESTLKLLEDSVPNQPDVDAKVRTLIEGEYVRQIGKYARIDHAMREKYGMTFEEFVARRIVAEQEYTWEVEKDAMDWEMAFSRCKDVTRKLKELQHSESTHSI